ncbi:hypothetical protein GF340_01910 [Candidatus Peregrinibacteria bacterium]|nr:hypothetical protein [Candidatus Peregrinibacteria bacterium]
MSKLNKFTMFLVGSVLVGTLLTLGGTVSFATPEAPTQPEATTCTDCQDIQDNLDLAYSDLNDGIEMLSLYDLENLMLTAAEQLYEGDLNALQTELDADLLSDTSCTDESAPYAYYSSFNFNGTLYCFENENMWSTFWSGLNELAVDNPSLSDAITTTETDGMTTLNDVTAISNTIDVLMGQLTACEEEYCPFEIVCPDCEAIAEELKMAIADLDQLELEADLLDAALEDLETQINEAEDKLEELETLRDEFRKLVLDAGGKTDADCDNFEVGPGQAWGIAHTFGDVQWCFTSESQIEDFIKNMDEYWETHSSKHLPSEEELNAEIDELMNDYFDTLTLFNLVLDEISANMEQIEKLTQDLEECIDELKVLQGLGYCTDQSTEGFDDDIQNGKDATGEGYQPEGGEETGSETEPESEGPTDIFDHWAEEIIKGLFDAGIVSGDGETGDFRPDDPIIRAEAAKIVTLAMGVEELVCYPGLYPDVTEDDWFCEYVGTAVDEGYFEGYADNTFGPANPILRGEAAAVILRALDFTIPEYDEYIFPDIDGDEWYANYAQKANDCGIMEGRDGMFAGNEEITRAELAKIVSLALVDELDEASCSS